MSNKMDYFKTGEEGKVISKYLSWIFSAILGAGIGLTLAYFFSGSTDTTSLASGALLGGLIGLYIGVSAAVPPSRTPHSERSDLESSGGAS